MESAHKKVQRIMLDTEARRNHNAKALGLGGSHVTKGGDYIDDNDDHKEDMQQLLMARDWSWTRVF